MKSVDTNKFKRTIKYKKRAIETKNQPLSSFYNARSGSASFIHSFANFCREQSRSTRVFKVGITLTVSLRDERKLRWLAEQQGKEEMLRQKIDQAKIWRETENVMRATHGRGALIVKVGNAEIAIKVD